MKKIIFSLLVLSSVSSFAGTGSSMDVAMSISYGYSSGCAEVDSTTDKLRIVSCKVGESMKKAGISGKQFEAYLDALENTLPEYNSICGK